MINDKLTKELQNQISNNKNKIDELSDLKYILATTTTATANFTKITLNSVVLQKGNFTLSNGNIVIPSGVSLVRVSGGIMGDTTNKTTRYLWGEIRHNNTLVSSHMSPVNGDDYIGCSMPPTIVEVQEGDTISLTASNSAGVKNRTGRSNVWVFVEKINNVI